MAMPADANPAGDIFGGWLMSHMDVAGAVAAIQHAGGRVVTVAVDAMTFHKPVYVGDVVSFYGELVRVGRTSMAIHVEAWARRGRGNTEERVTAGTFTYVAVDEDRRPHPIAPAAPAGS
jgi:acyl-CoA thioesterase YciA